VEYHLVFEVGERIPEIAFGVAALFALVVFVVIGLFEFDDLPRFWPVVLGVALVLGVLEMAIDKSPADAPFLVIPGIVGVFEYVRSRDPDLADPKLPPGAMATMFGAFALVFVSLNGVGHFGAIGLSQRLQAGAVDELEGRVTAFYEVAAGKNECWSLADRRFCYSDWVSTPGFNRTRSLGGPIAPGAQIRLAVVGDTIVRLEVAAGQ
jgi:hypothetical protein